RVARRPGRERRRHPGSTVAARAFQRFAKEGFARREMRIEAAVREAGLLHHLGDADAGEAIAPQRARRHLHDAIVRELLLARCELHPRIVAWNMTIVISTLATPGRRASCRVEGREIHPDKPMSPFV